jgi:nitrogen-specific signal transduction histidine kinase/CheY-like chemotaxis protein
MDGTAFDVESTAIPFTFEGRPGCIVFFREIGDRKQEEAKRRTLEQQLLQSQKMEAVGRLAGGIAHDFNNLLMVIQSYTELLQDSLPAHDAQWNSTQQITKAAERAASLTGQLLAFSRKQVFSPSVLDINEVIAEAAKMLRRIIGEDIELHVNSEEQLWAVKADPDQVVQVLMNLCVNARDSMAQGGTLTIETENVKVGNGHTAGRPYVSPGEYVSISVADTGVGISKELQDQIFEPFFTTKELGKGTGLGLAMVYGIVKQSGGYIWVDSEVGQGAKFTIYLSRANEAVTHRTAGVTAGERPQGTETLLVVEDEAALRDVMCDFLKSLGYKVLAAGSGQQALAIFSEENNIDLLITDVVMPKMSGRELSQMLGALKPTLKSIHMSGYTDDVIFQGGELGTTFLHKPFSLGTLACKVRDALSPVHTAP